MSKPPKRIILHATFSLSSPIKETFLVPGSTAKNGCELQHFYSIYQYQETPLAYRFAPPRLLDDEMRARGSPRIATRPPMKDAPAATTKAGAFPPPKS
jgi:hypothetical protein